MKSISPTKNPSDRFIPISISPNLKCEINDHSQTPSPNNHSNYEIDNKHKLKAGETYKKLLFKELLDPPSSNSYSNDSNNDINNNTFKLCYSSISKRKINFSSNTTNINKINHKQSVSPKSNHSNSSNKKTSKRKTISIFPFSKNNPFINETKNENNSNQSKKVKHILPDHTIQYKDAIDNFYFNILDMYSIKTVAIGAKMNILIYNPIEYENTSLQHPKYMPPVLKISSDIKSQNYTYDMYDFPSDPVCVKFIHSNQILHSNYDGDLLLTDLLLNKTIPIITNQIGNAIFTMDQHPHNSDLIYTGNENGIIQCIDLRMNQNTLMNTQLYSHKHNAEVCKVKICPKTAKTLISGGNDNKGIVYDLRKNKKIMEIKHNAAIKGIAINKEGNKFVTGGGTYDKMIKLWDLKKQTLISETLTDSQITNIEFIDNDQILVSFGYIGNNMVLYKLNYDQLKEESMNSVNLSNMKLGFESEGDDVIDIFKPEVQFEPHNKRVLFMAKARLGEYVTTASHDGVVKIWKTNKYIKSFNGFDLFNNSDVR